MCSFIRLAWRMKAFPSNISVTILNRRQYDNNLSNDFNQVDFISLFLELTFIFITEFRFGMMHKNIFVRNYFVIKLNIESSIRRINILCSISQM